MAEQEGTVRDIDTVIPLRRRNENPEATAVAAGRRPAPETPENAPEKPEKLWREVLGGEIRRQRVARGERLADIAERAGISPQYLSEVERGRKDPSSEMLEAVAGALGKSSFELAGDTIRASGTAAAPGAQMKGVPASASGVVLLAA